MFRVNHRHSAAYYDSDPPLSNTCNVYAPQPFDLKQILMFCYLNMTQKCALHQAGIIIPV